MMELDGLAQDVDSLFGISGLKEDLMDVAILGTSAGIAVVGGEMLFSKVPKLKDLSMPVKAGVAVVLGATGGIAVGRMGTPVYKAVGAGIAAGLIGWGVAKGVMIVADMVGKPAEKVGQVSDRDLLLGMNGVVDNDISVSDYRPIPGQTNGIGQYGEDVSVSDYQPIPGQTNGLGQAGDVYTTDLQPMPGMNGRDSYLSALS